MIYLSILGILVAFYLGIFVGIRDCKRRFEIPKNAVGVDDNGFVYR